MSRICHFSLSILPVCYDSISFEGRKFTFFSTFADMKIYHIPGILAMIMLLLPGCSKTSMNATTKNIQKSDLRTQYMNLRETWVSTDLQQTSYADQQLNPSEAKLDQKLRQLQQEMIRNYKDAHFFPPAGNFYQYKSHIQENHLFQLLKKMPKGGLLHLHPPAAGQADWIISKALSTPNCYVYWGQPNSSFVNGQIHFFQQENVPPGFFPIQQLDRQSASFKDSLRSLLTFDSSIYADGVDIWREFESTFQRIFGFTYYQPIFRDYYQHAMELLLEDGIQHVELREVYGVPIYDLEHPTDYFNSDTVVRYYREIEAKLQQKEPDFTLKTIYTDIRFRTQREIQQAMKNAFDLRLRHPDMVKGFDLVAEEDAGNSTLFYLDTWLSRDSLTKVYGIDMPLYFHGGESDWSSVDNLYDCILLGSKRIGHGFNLFRFPKLMTEVRKQDICLEINPLSNQILGYISDLRIHPASYYLSQGIAITLNSDDPLIFDYEGLTYDYWTAFMAWELDLKALKQLAQNSLKYSALSEKEKQEALQAWELKWNDFVDYANEKLE